MRSIKFIGISVVLCLFLIKPAFSAVMLSNLSEVHNAYYTVSAGGDEAQGFTTNGFSYNLTTVTIDISEPSNPSGNFTVSIYSDNAGRPGSMVPNGLLSGPDNPSVGENTYTANDVISLAPNTTYWVVTGVSSGVGIYGVSMTETSSHSGAWSFSGYEAYLESGNWNSDELNFYMRISVSADLAESASIPTINEWGMIILSLILGVSAIWMLRRRQIT